MSATSVLGLHFEAPHPVALSDGAATDLIIAVGAGGSFVLVLLLTVLTMRRSARKTVRRRLMATVGRGRGDGQDAYPPQPYSADEPNSHRPYSRPYRIPRQEAGRTSTNGSRPAESTGTGVQLGPWPPKPTNDEDSNPAA